ncbi:MAG TPA: ribonuclease Z [Candidatus Caldiarchaeum subterraneum]|uniref:Ribonuclease Z n=1 Tax=Caldiarchaeum subterraneum TaxID=311458 RepID=A0A832ZW91_CALS0|nr:ribonuclease Z [Candidatus Caldarchaeum subterraneum]
MTEMRITFLGTGGAMPSKTRNLPSIAIKYSGAVFVVDCGEGTQRQFIQSGLGFKRDLSIFITHMHGDHVLGLPGLLYTMSMLSREDPVEIYGPKGLTDFLKAVLRQGLGAINYPIKVYEVKPGDVIEKNNLVVRCVETDHVIENICYVFQEKRRKSRMKVEFLEEMGIPRGPLWGRLQRGEAVIYGGRVIKPEEAVEPPKPGRKIVYTGDTRPCEAVVEAAREADVLIHDATFDSSLKAKAEEDKHSTAAEAAEVAKRAKVKKLFLFHISPRYEKNYEILLQEARSIFPNTQLSYDLMSITIPYNQ